MYKTTSDRKSCQPNYFPNCNCITISCDLHVVKPETIASVVTSLSRYKLHWSVETFYIDTIIPQLRKNIPLNIFMRHKLLWSHDGIQRYFILIHPCVRKHQALCSAFNFLAFQSVLRSSMTIHAKILSLKGQINCHPLI